MPVLLKGSDVLEKSTASILLFLQVRSVEEICEQQIL
jgi:hypothetical protein